MSDKDLCKPYILQMVAGVDELADKQAAARVMERCGRACARLGAVASAKSCSGNLDALLKLLGTWIGGKNVRRDGDIIHITYEKCFCHLKLDVPKDTADTFCLCSRGWLKEMFETVLNATVEVELLASIKQGDPACRFRVKLGLR